MSDTEIEINATTIDINGAVALNGAITGATNITLSGELDAATGDFSGAVDIDGALDVAGTTNLDVVDIDGAVDIAATTTVSAANKVQFRDAAIYLNSSVDGQLDIVADTEIQIAATTIDINGAVDISGALTLATDLAVAQGGTGASTFTADGVLYGAGTGAVGATAVGTDGHVLTSNGSGSAPTFQATQGSATDINGLSDAKSIDQYSIGLGTNALRVGEALKYNNALGNDAGYNVTSGTENIFMGNAAGYTLSFGAASVFLGASSGYRGTTGSSNTYVGAEAAYGSVSSAPTGNNNTAIGRGALKAIEGSANSNTVVGSLTHDNVTTGDLNISLGYNNSSSAAGVDSEIVIGNSITGAGTNTVRIGTAGGNATLGLDGSDTSWAAASDSRLKKDVADSTAGLSFIDDLRPVTFKWESKNALADSLPQYNADSSDPVYGVGKAHHGFIAQEVKTIIDDHSEVANGHNIWRQDPDGTQQLAPSALVPMLVKAIQELSAKNTDLESRLSVLEG